MRAIAHPDCDVANVLQTCNASVGLHLRTDFALSELAFRRIEFEYQTAGLSGDLSDFAATLDTTGVVPGAAEMRGLYLNRMVPAKSSGRMIYEAIRDADGGLCALCAVREATTVDHYLPKEVFPSLSFMPINLLPACGRCNGYKLTFTPQRRDEELLHPYFDDISGRQWVDAEVVAGNPVPRFEVLQAADDPDMSCRVDRHFTMFRLADTYGKYAANELVSLSEMLVAYFGSEPPADSIQRYLIIQANSHARAKSRNHWQAVSYKAWAQSEWFLAGGFEAIRMRGGLRDMQMHDAPRTD